MVQSSGVHRTIATRYGLGFSSNGVVWTMQNVKTGQPPTHFKLMLYGQEINGKQHTLKRESGLSGHYAATTPATRCQENVFMHAPRILKLNGCRAPWLTQGRETTKEIEFYATRHRISLTRCGQHKSPAPLLTPRCQA